MEFFQLLDLIENVKPQNIRLYLIVRNLKNGVKKGAAVLDKYDFKAYQVEIDSEIRTHFHEITLEKIGKQVTNEVVLQEYDPITDDTETAFTYPIKNKTLSFTDVVVNQLKGNVPKVKDLEEILVNGELWSYCVGFTIGNDDHLYTFRKFSESKVAVDTKENPEKNFVHKSLRTWFNTDSKKLELLQGQTMNLDKSIDCIFYKDTFYVIQKTQFEHIVGVAEEFKETSIQFVDELEATKKFEGLNLLREQVETKPTIHRKLSRLARLENHKNIDGAAIKNMQQAAMLENKEIKMKNGKFLIENEEDIDLLIKMLAEFYKTGMVFGKKYGTFAGKVVSN